MHATKTTIALGALLVGCGAGALASHVVIPSARAGTSPTRWEYFCARGGNLDEWNRAGAQGWELVGESNAVAGDCFKRPLP